MDKYDKKIIRTLQSNARISLKALSEVVSLSQPACTERLRKLEATGVIRGYAAQPDLAALGYPLRTVVRVRPLPGYLAETEKKIKSLDQVLHCYKVTGDDAFVCIMALRNIQELDVCLSQIAQIATTSTAVVKSIPVENHLPII